MFSFRHKLSINRYGSHLYPRDFGGHATSVRIQAYLNKTHNQSRDKLHVEHSQTTRTLESVLVVVI